MRLVKIPPRFRKIEGERWRVEMFLFTYLNRRAVELLDRPSVSALGRPRLLWAAGTSDWRRTIAIWCRMSSLLPDWWIADVCRPPRSWAGRGPALWSACRSVRWPSTASVAVTLNDPNRAGRQSGGFRPMAGPWKRRPELAATCGGISEQVGDR